MENKYYTPDITEFHIGFEYETKRKDENTWIKRIWNKFDVYSSLENKNEEIRVKYLDKNDIETFNFINRYVYNIENNETLKHSCNPYQYLLKSVYFCNSNRPIDIKLTDLSRNIYRLEMYERNYFAWYTIFEGYIKNINELKQLLKNNIKING